MSAVLAFKQPTPRVRKPKEDPEKYKRLTAIHLSIRQAKLSEMDIDLARIFEGTPIDQIFDKDLNEVFRIQEIRVMRQRRKFR